MTEVDLYKKEALRLLHPNYGKGEITRALEAVGMTCKFNNYSAKAKVSSGITVVTPWSGRDVLINFSKWAYLHWPMRGSFWLTLSPGGFYVLLECEHEDRTVSMMVNGENGYECRYLQGIADLSIDRLHPHGLILPWSICGEISARVVIDENATTAK